jgi:energy-coupling factor transporter ATP-binding protein EcfA2
MLMNPRALILDEATSALDSEIERLVQDTLDKATHDRTTIAIAHRLSTIMKADVIFGLDEGRPVDTTSLLAHGGLYWRLYTEQFGAGQVETRLADGSSSPTAWSSVTTAPTSVPTSPSSPGPTEVDPGISHATHRRSDN